MEELNKATKDLGNIIPKIKLDTDKIEDPIVIKFKRWALIILSVLVGGGALILIIKSIIGKVF